MITKAKPKRAVRPVAAGKRAGSQSRRGTALSRERIAAAAMALVDREGLPALSTRRLGEELGCEAMSIYHHFPSKAHLMDALVDLMLAQARVPLLAEWDWLERLRRSAHGFRAMALKHPKFFPFFAVHRLNMPSGVAFIDGIIGILREAGFTIEALHELYAPPGATDHPYYHLATASWAQQWPAEELWAARLPS